MRGEFEVCTIKGELEWRNALREIENELRGQREQQAQLWKETSIMKNQ